ncbi:MAG: HAD family phosphatase [Chitinophagaceae bacterium]|nr:MAG: HAD family phosphatase [Chitinophagaceae bacterium]
MADLKNIIFDLGGVLLDIDYSKTKHSFQELGFTNFDEMYSQYTADPLFSNLETGKASNEEFLAAMVKAGENRISSEQVSLAWNAMLLNFRISSLDFLDTLSQKFRLYLLSNTNAIHLEAFSQIFLKETGKASLDSYFTKAYYSNKIGYRKPNEDIFEFVLKDAGIAASETLFIDDSYNNIETAEKMGFKTHLLKPGEKIEELTYR